MWVMSSMRGNSKRAEYTARHLPLIVNNRFCDFVLKTRQTEYCVLSIVNELHYFYASNFAFPVLGYPCIFTLELIKLLLSLYQAWKHLSSKVFEILEELRAVQVRVSV